MHKYKEKFMKMQEKNLYLISESSEINRCFSSQKTKILATALVQLIAHLEPFENHDECLNALRFDLRAFDDRIARAPVSNFTKAELKNHIEESMSKEHYHIDINEYQEGCHYAN